MNCQQAKVVNDWTNAQGIYWKISCSGVKYSRWDFIDRDAY